MTRQAPNSHSGFLDLCRRETQQNRILRLEKQAQTNPHRARTENLSLADLSRPPFAG